MRMSSINILKAKNWLDRNFFSSSCYKIGEDGKIDINIPGFMQLEIDDGGKYSIPNYIKFRIVKGDCEIICDNMKNINAQSPSEIDDDCHLSLELCIDETKYEDIIIILPHTIRGDLIVKLGCRMNNHFVDGQYLSWESIQREIKKYIQGLECELKTRKSTGNLNIGGNITVNIIIVGYHK